MYGVKFWGYFSFFQFKFFEGGICYECGVVFVVEQCVDIYINVWVIYMVNYNQYNYRGGGFNVR